MAIRIELRNVGRVWLCRDASNGSTLATGTTPQTAVDNLEETVKREVARMRETLAVWQGRLGSKGAVL